MKRKGILKKAILIALTVLTIMSCSVMVFAAGWDGDGATGGSASSTAHGDYGDYCNLGALTHLLEGG